MRAVMNHEDQCVLRCIRAPLRIPQCILLCALPPGLLLTT